MKKINWIADTLDGEKVARADYTNKKGLKFRLFYNKNTNYVGYICLNACNFDSSYTTNPDAWIIKEIGE